MSMTPMHAGERANARHNTFPTTSKRPPQHFWTPRLHGLCASDLLISAEKTAEFDVLAAGFQAALHPHGELQGTLFDEVLAAAWQLRRLRRMENGLCAGGQTDSAILEDAALQKKLDRLARHHDRVERTFHRCLRALQALQTQPANEGNALHLVRARTPALIDLLDDMDFPDLTRAA